MIPEDALFRCADALARSFPALIEARITIGYYDQRPPAALPGGAFPLSVIIRPLLEVHALRVVKLRLDSMPMPGCAADEFALLARSWPALEQFTYTFIPTDHRNAPISEHLHPVAFCTTIVAFARHCPRLLELQLPCMVLEDDSDAEEIVQKYCDEQKEEHGLVEMTFLSMESWNDETGNKEIPLALRVFPFANIDLRTPNLRGHYMKLTFPYF